MTCCASFLLKCFFCCWLRSGPTEATSELGVGVKALADTATLIFYSIHALAACLFALAH